MGPPLGCHPGLAVWVVAVLMDGRCGGRALRRTGRSGGLLLRLVTRSARHRCVIVLAAARLPVGVPGPHPGNAVLYHAPDLGLGRPSAVRELPSRGLGIARSLRLERARRLLYGRAVLRLARQRPQLLIALPAGFRAEHVADRQADDECDAVPHLAPLFPERFR